MSSKKVYLYFCGLFGAVFLYLLVFAAFFPGAQKKIGDTVDFFSYLYSRDKINADKFVLVEIDNASLQKIPYSWPWERSLYAKVLNNINRDNPKTASFDLLFRGSRVTEEDLAFAQALKSFSGKTILAYALSKEGKPIYPLDIVSNNASALGIVNMPLDEDSICRRFRGYIRFKGFFDYSFIVKIASLIKGRRPVLESENIIKIGREKIFLDRQRTAFIRYLIKPGDIKTISFYKVLNNNFPPGFFKGRYVFIGAASPLIHDEIITPFGIMPGVYTVINGVYQIVSGRSVRSIPLWADILLGLIVLSAIAGIVYYFGFLRNFIFSLGVLLGLLWLAVFSENSGWKFNYGAITLSSLFFWITANIGNYIYFFNSLHKIKQKTIIDPISGLFTPRYFYYRANFSLQENRFRRDYLFLEIMFGKFFESGSSMPAETDRQFWEKLASFLRQNKNALWAGRGREIVVGFVPVNKKHLQGWVKNLRDGLQEIFGYEDAAKQVRIGCVLLKKPVFFSRISEILEKKTDVSKDNIVYLADSEIAGCYLIPVSSKSGREDMLESLNEDIEERNIELLKAFSQVQQEQARRKKSYLQVIVSLVNALEEKDIYTRGHTQRVCDYAVILAEYLGLPKEEVENIKTAALLHDIGKIGIPDSILNKKGRLTEEEFSFIKKHPVLGVKILEPIDEFKKFSSYILYHHERFDGRGYPHGLSGNMIPLGARIIAIADSFDAIVSGRSYKKGFSFPEAVNRLKEVKGKQFSPELVDKFELALKQKGLL